jgi:hypothetical protein
MLERVPGHSIFVAGAIVYLIHINTSAIARRKMACADALSRRRMR